jgi:hypothetical protein
MGTTSIQHARIVAFSPPSVKDGQVALRVMLAGLDVIELSFSRNLGAEITASLRELFGLPAPSGSKRPGHKLPERQRYKYRRVVAHVTAGAAWADAARAEGVDACNVKTWWARQKKLAAARAPAAPVLKPSGAIL